MSVFGVLIAGFAAGATHVLIGPDHLAAVAPLAVNQKKHHWSMGVRWGLGHASGVILVAILAWLFREVLPVELFSSHCERLVGVMLIGIGIWGLLKALKLKFHIHEHSHPGDTHKHIHAHDKSGVGGHVHTHAAMAVGVLHGLAGGSHFLGVLPALAMPTRVAAASYLLAFGIGTILAMAGFSLLVGTIGAKLESSGNYFRGLMVGVAGAAIFVGGYWLL